MLKISDTVELPPNYITERGALLAVSGGGKSNACRAIAEEFYAAKLPFVAIDPKGDWWGLRTGRDGKPKGGIDVAIFGGDHGDVPLEPGSGRLISDLVVGQRLSCILDLSGFEQKTEKNAFLYDFGRRLYHRNRDPLHLFCDECDEYIPQKPAKDQQPLLDVFENIGTRGRQRGLGMTLSSQRSARVNKNVLYMAETLFALRTTGPRDIETVADWMKHHGADRSLIASLAGLESGEAWVWSPYFLKKTERFRFRLSHTFDSGATPTNHTSNTRRPPATLSDIDLSALKQSMAATIERAAADDPVALRQRIAELERQLRQQKPDEGARAELERARVWARGIEGELNRTRRKIDLASGSLRAAITDANSAMSILDELSWTQDSDPITDITTGIAKAEAEESRPPSPRPAPAALNVCRIEEGWTDPAPPEARSSGRLGKCARALLGALIQHGDLSLQQAAIIARYPGGSAIVEKSAGELRKLGLVIGGNQLLQITPAGQQHPELRGLEPLPTGKALAQWWLGELGKCEAGLLREVLRRHPKPTPLEHAATAIGYPGPTPIVEKSAGKLRKLMLVSGSNAGMTANERLVS